MKKKYLLKGPKSIKANRAIPKRSEIISDKLFEAIFDFIFKYEIRFESLNSFLRYIC